MGNQFERPTGGFADAAPNEAKDVKQSNHFTNTKERD
jgi:hypothetical protein